MQSYALAYLLEGEFPSYFNGKPVPVKEVKDKEEEKETTNKNADNSETNESSAPPTENKQADIDVSQILSEGQFIAKSKPAKIFIMAASEMMKDNVLGCF
jgi:hypothetical protein